jgi:hypothetical protein
MASVFFSSPNWRISDRWRPVVEKILLCNGGIHGRDWFYRPRTSPPSRLVRSGINSILQVPMLALQAPSGPPSFASPSPHAVPLLPCNRRGHALVIFGRRRRFSRPNTIINTYFQLSVSWRPNPGFPRPTQYVSLGDSTTQLFEYLSHFDKDKCVFCGTADNERVCVGIRGMHGLDAWIRTGFQRRTWW